MTTRPTPTAIAEAKGRLRAALAQARTLSNALYEIVARRYDTDDERSVVAFTIDDSLVNLLDLLDAAELT